MTQSSGQEERHDICVIETGTVDAKAHDLCGNDVNDGFGDKRDTGSRKTHHELKQLVKKTHESSIFLVVNPQIQVKKCTKELWRHQRTCQKKSTQLIWKLCSAKK